MFIFLKGAHYNKIGTLTLNLETACLYHGYHCHFGIVFSLYAASNIAFGAGKELVKLIIIFR